METIVLPGVSPSRAAEIAALGASIGLTEFNPTTVNWDVPASWRQSGTYEGSGGAVMPEAAGYGIILGFGAFFSVFTTFLVFLEQKFAGVTINSEHFNTAGRNVKTGLTASVIVSQWTWAATLLQSSNVAWTFGLSGPYWYAAGASVQVLLFGVLAIEVKRKAPTAHTVCEMVDVRWGKAAHITFIIFCFLTNIIVTSMLILGGSAVMEASAAVNRTAANFLTPIGVLIYTMAGGLKATFLASYLHTTIIFVGLTFFITMVYIVQNDCDARPMQQCNQLGSAGLVWERIKFNVALPARNEGTNPGEGFAQGPVGGNAGGSYLTMLSEPGLMFGIINVVGNFGTVFVDQSYWQSAIAADPASAHKGYMLGGLVWFTIPFALATSLGLASLSLNAQITPGDAGSGLVPPASATILMGPGGGIMMIIMLFMAIVSTGSAEAIAVSSLVTYDIYRKYFKPGATNMDIMKVSRAGVCGFCLLCGILPTILDAIGVNLGWVYNFMGIVIGSAVPPFSFLLLWDGCSANAAIISAWLGQLLAIIVWLVEASNQSPGDLFAGTGMLKAQLAGNLTALCSSTFLCVVISVATGLQNYKWDELKDGIKLVDDGSSATSTGPTASEEFLLMARAWIIKYGVGGTFFLMIGWPLSVLPWGVYPKALYALWVSISVVWGYTASIVIVFLPLYENKATIIAVLTCKPAVPGETKTVTQTADA